MQIDAAGYLKLVESRFEFLCVPQAGEMPLMWGAFKAAVLPGAPWVSSCGYWNGWFILRFDLDIRDRFHQVSLCRRALGGLIIEPVIARYNIDGLIQELEGKRSCSEPSFSSAFEEDVIFHLDYYAKALDQFGEKLLVPSPGKGLGEWDYSWFERHRSWPLGDEAGS